MEGLLTSACRSDMAPCPTVSSALWLVSASTQERDALVAEHVQSQRHLYACPELANKTNQAGYPWPVTPVTPQLLDCSSLKRLPDNS